MDEIVGAPVSTYIIPGCAGIRVLLQVVFVPQTSAEEPLSETFQSRTLWLVWDMGFAMVKLHGQT